MKLSLVIPCYNEEGNVQKFVEVISQTFKNKIFNYELIFINDGSQDDTLNKLKELCNNSDQNIKIINFSRNFGKEAGMYAGLKEAKGDYITIPDYEIDFLLDKLDAECPMYRDVFELNKEEMEEIER